MNTQQRIEELAEENNPCNDKTTLGLLNRHNYNQAFTKGATVALENLDIDIFKVATIINDMENKKMDIHQAKQQILQSITLK